MQTMEIYKNYECLAAKKNMKIKRQTAGLTQKQFAELFDIPLDTVKSWESGRRNPPEWAQNLILEKLDQIEQEQKKIDLLVIEPMISKYPVMSAIADKMDMLFKVICNPKNERKDLSMVKKQIEELYNAYFAIRGNKGTLVYVEGIDDETNKVKTIYEFTKNK